MKSCLQPQYSMLFIYVMTHEVKIKHRQPSSVNVIIYYLPLSCFFFSFCYFWHGIITICLFLEIEHKTKETTVHCTKIYLECFVWIIFMHCDVQFVIQKVHLFKFLFRFFIKECLQISFVTAKAKIVSYVRVRQLCPLVTS